jgi:hypothetical protein
MQSQLKQQQQQQEDVNATQDQHNDSSLNDEVNKPQTTKQTNKN